MLNVLKSKEDFDINLFDNLKFPIADNSVDLIYSQHKFSSFVIYQY